MMFCECVMLISGWTLSGDWILDLGDLSPMAVPGGSPGESYASRGLQVILLDGLSMCIIGESQIWEFDIDDLSSSSLDVPFPALTLPFCEYESIMEPSGCLQWTPRSPAVSLPFLRIPWIHTAKPSTTILLEKLTQAFIPGPSTPQDQDSHCLSIPICFPVTIAFSLF